MRWFTSCWSRPASSWLHAPESSLEAMPIAGNSSSRTTAERHRRPRRIVVPSSPSLRPVDSESSASRSAPVRSVRSRHHAMRSIGSRAGGSPAARRRSASASFGSAGRSNREPPRRRASALAGFPSPASSAPPRRCAASAPRCRSRSPAARLARRSSSRAPSCGDAAFAARPRCAARPRAARPPRRTPPRAPGAWVVVDGRALTQAVEPVGQRDGILERGVRIPARA